MKIINFILNIQWRQPRSQTEESAGAHNMLRRGEGGGTHAA